MSSTLPSQMYLVRRYYTVAATFVVKEYTAIFQKYVRDLTKRCCNIWIKYVYIIWYNLNYFSQFENLCHLYNDSTYIWENVTTRLLQRLSQISSAKLSSNVVKTLCVSWVSCYNLIQTKADIRWEWSYTTQNIHMAVRVWGTFR